MYLKLNNNYMGVLAEDILYGLDIKHLLVHEANISSIHRDAFQDLGDRLESLDLSKNHLTEVSNFPTNFHLDLILFRSVNRPGLPVS